jgi:hypothetical protein
MDITTGYIEGSKPLVIILILIVVTMGMINGYKYFQFAKSDPRFCELCHIMKEPYKSWQVSSHNKIACQECHATTLIEQNSLLLSYVVSGTKKETSQKHGRIAPWNSCRSCHPGEAEYGTISMRQSYGHARPVICPQPGTFQPLTMTAFVSSGTTALP